jgi:multiple sugar transport system ATP-binding protein
VRNGQQLILGLRPEALAIADGVEPSAGHAIVKAVVNLVEPLGSDTLVTVTMAGLDVVARLPPLQGLAPGIELPLVVDLSRMHLFDAQTGQALVGVDSQ